MSYCCRNVLLCAKAAVARQLQLYEVAFVVTHMHLLNSYSTECVVVHRGAKCRGKVQWQSREDAAPDGQFLPAQLPMGLLLESGASSLFVLHHGAAHHQ